MNELRDLYQEVILDHSRQPRNFREEPAASRKAEGYNPLCGDKATVYLTLDGDVLRDVSFVGKGCSISTASASMMTESLKGKSRAEAEALFQRFRGMLTGEPAAAGAPDLGQARRRSPGLAQCGAMEEQRGRSSLPGRRQRRPRQPLERVPFPCPPQRLLGARVVLPRLIGRADRVRRRLQQHPDLDPADGQLDALAPPPGMEGIRALGRPRQVEPRRDARCGPWRGAKKSSSRQKFIFR